MLASNRSLVTGHMHTPVHTLQIATSLTMIFAGERIVELLGTRYGFVESVEIAQAKVVDYL